MYTLLILIASTIALALPAKRSAYEGSFNFGFNDLQRRQTVCALGTSFNSTALKCDPLQNLDPNYCWPGFSYAAGDTCTQNPVQGVDLAASGCAASCDSPDSNGNTFSGYLVSSDGHICSCELPSYYDAAGNCSECPVGLVPNTDANGFAASCFSPPAGYIPYPVILSCGVVQANNLAASASASASLASAALASASSASAAAAAATRPPAASSTLNSTASPTTLPTGATATPVVVVVNGTTVTNSATITRSSVAPSGATGTSTAAAAAGSMGPAVTGSTGGSVNPSTGGGGSIGSGSSGTGVANGGSSNAGSNNAGSPNTGASNAGFNNAGPVNTGSLGTGSSNAGLNPNNAGSSNTGSSNAGSNNAGVSSGNIVSGASIAGSDNNAQQPPNNSPSALQSQYQPPLGIGFQPMTVVYMPMGFAAAPAAPIAPVINVVSTVTVLATSTLYVIVAPSPVASSLLATGTVATPLAAVTSIGVKSSAMRGEFSLPLVGVGLTSVLFMLIL